MTIREGDTTDTGVELTGYYNEHQSVPSDEKNRTPSTYMAEGSYDTLAPADESTAPSAQVVPLAQNGQNASLCCLVRMLHLAFNCCNI